MELREFISKALLSIVNGVNDANLNIIVLSFRAQNTVEVIQGLKCNLIYLILPNNPVNLGWIKEEV